jgi:hypothetical protein
MGLDEIMRKWHQDLDNPKEHRDATATEGIDGDDPFEDNFNTLSEKLPAYKDFISRAPAYEWLLQSIRKELLLSVAEENVQANIRQTVLDCLPKTRTVSRKESPDIHTAIFAAEWDPLLFLQEQEYSESPEEALERSIAITGSKKDAQATTTIQYLSQTWPSMGIHLLSLTKMVVQGVPNRAYLCMHPNTSDVCSLSSNITIRHTTRQNAAHCMV